MIGNLLMRMYGRIWDKWLQKEIIINDRLKGFMLLVDECYKNVKIPKSINNPQQTERICASSR